MKHLKKLTRKQKIILNNMELNSNDFLRLTQNHKGFTVVNIKTNKSMPLRY